MSTPLHPTQPGLSVAATEEFLRTLAEISGDPSGGTHQSSEADARGNMPIVPSGGDMLAMWSDVGAGLQYVTSTVAFREPSLITRSQVGGMGRVFGGLCSSVRDRGVDVSWTIIVYLSFKNEMNARRLSVQTRHRAFASAAI